MDSNALERERGITIFSKCAAFNLERDGITYRINVVDTPGHADFGGEVERILSMVDGVILVVDANEGPMAQTKYVLQKALRAGLRAMVVMNKVDRPGALHNAPAVESELFDLFATHLKDDAQLEYPTLYASAKNGWAVASLDELKNPATYKGTMQPLFDAILKHTPVPQNSRTDPFSMIVTQLEPNTFLGKCLSGKVHSGRLRTGDALVALDRDGKTVSEGRVTKLFVRQGMNQVVVDEVAAGEMVTVAGFPTSTVNHTLCAPGVKPLPSSPIDPPTLAMTFGVNDSPFAGQEGNLLTSNMITDRLVRECDSNVSLQIVRSKSGDAVEVRGRGELQLGILMETMRREGFEIAVSAPRVLFRKDENGVELEPIEELTLDMDVEHAGIAIEKLAQRKGVMRNFEETNGRARLLFEIPVRGLIGYQREFKNDTHGTGIFNHRFLKWEKHCGPIDLQRKGVLVSNAAGDCTAYSLETLEQRGVLFVSPSDKVYVGMIVGEHSRENDLEVNPAKGKHLTNVRSVIKEDFVRLVPPRPITLETSMSYIQDDELMEVTPKSVRLRKRELDPARRKVDQRRRKQSESD